MGYIKKYNAVLGKRKNKLPFMVAIFIINSFIEIIGLSLIFPLLYFLVDLESFNEKFYFLNNFSIFRNALFEFKLLIISACIIIVYYIKSIFSYQVMKMIANFSYITQAELIKELVKGYQELPYQKTIEIKESHFFNIISNHIRYYTELSLIGSMRLVSETVLVLTIIVYLAYNDPAAVFFLVIFFSLISIVYFFFMKDFFTAYGRKFATATENILLSVKEIIGSFKEIKILGKEEFFNKRVKRAASEMSSYGGRAVAYTQMTKYVLESAIITFMLMLAAYQTFTRSDTSEALVYLGIFSVAAIRMLPSTFQIITCISWLKLSEKFLTEIYDFILLFENSNKDNRGYVSQSIEDKDTFESLKLKNVDFHYEKDKYIFKNLNLEIKKGDFVGVYGSSGSGKTTLIDLMLGLLKPSRSTDSKGGIFVNDLEIDKNSEFWREKLAYIPQKIFLINDTIKRNVTVTDDNIVDEDLLNHSIKSSQLNDLVQSLDEGLNYNVGDDGKKLSGGQRQRLVLARAIYHEKEFIIFDEATSSLDKSTEKIIIDEISLLKGKKTIIFVTHNIELLGNTDYNIYVNKNNIEIRNSKKS